jgi:hypothetical protein
VTNPTLLAIRNVADCDAFPRGFLYVGSSPSADVHTGQPCWTIAGLQAGAQSFIVIANVAPAPAGGSSTALPVPPPASRPTQRPLRSSSRLPQLPCGIGARGHKKGPAPPTQCAPIAPQPADNLRQQVRVRLSGSAATRTAETFQNDAPPCSPETDVVAEGGEHRAQPDGKADSSPIQRGSPLLSNLGADRAKLAYAERRFCTPPGRLWYRRRARLRRVRPGTIAFDITCVPS